MYRFMRNHLPVISASLLACLSSGFFILYITHVEQQHADAVTRQQAKDFARLDEAVKARVAKIKAEAAKKKADEADAAKQVASTKATKTPSSVAASGSTATGGAHRNPANIDVIVNKKHSIIPLTFTPTVRTVSCSGRGATTIASTVVADFQALCQAATKANTPLDSSSSYRSYQTQVNTYNYWVSVSGKEAADTYSARPGYSEHQTGLSVDFRVPDGATLSDFTGTSQQKWLAGNAWRYGFIQRYTARNQKDTGYSAESWHYRYVGRSTASAYTQANAASLESFWGISGGGYN